MAFNWTKLLREIKRDCVVPIIGPELLPYHQTLSLPLAKALGVAEEHAQRGIGAVADAAGNALSKRAADELDVLLQGYTELPKALQQLAAIKEFRLILTTDYSSLIEQVLEARQEPHRSLGFSLLHRSDDIDGYPSDERLVYHLLGHLGRFGSIALARVDQLEYLCRLQAAGPAELLAVLREKKNLLFLGCDLPEWLTGFFMRTLLGRPLYETHYRGMEVIACRPATEANPASSSLTAFLRNNQFEVYQGDAHNFLEELFQHYITYPTHSSEKQRVSAFPGKGAVFVSYCRSDKEPVRLFVDMLRRNGVETWFDETSMMPGTAFDPQVRLAIQEDCCAFIPVISDRVFEREQSYFVREWGFAAEAMSEHWRDSKFVFPVSLQDLGPSLVDRLKRRFPEFSELHVETLAVGAGLSERFVESLKLARKQYERRRRSDRN